MASILSVVTSIPHPIHVVPAPMILRSASFCDILYLFFILGSMVLAFLFLKDMVKRNRQTRAREDEKASLEKARSAIGSGANQRPGSSQHVSMTKESSVNQSVKKPSEKKPLV